MTGTILLVDDNESMRRLLKTIAASNLARWNIVVESSESGALNAVRQEPIHIAVVDLFLTEPPQEQDPEGLHVLAALKERHPNCMRILISRKKHVGELPRSALSAFNEFVDFKLEDENSQSEQSYFELFRLPISALGAKLVSAKNRLKKLEPVPAKR